MWRVAPALRRRRQPGGGARSHSVLHVTTSFDLGGTQTQIKHLCTASPTRYSHTATELFPELNYLYRQGLTLDRERYVQGGAVSRLLGTAALNRNRRGFHQVQVHKLARDFASERPETVVGWGHEVCALTFVAAAIARVPRIVFCIRTFNPSFGWTDTAFGSLLQAAHRRMLPQTSAVIVNSTPLRDDYAAWAGRSADHIAVCPNGIAVETFAAPDRASRRAAMRRPYGIAADAVVFAAVGRFSPEKGQRSVIEANRLCREQGVRVTWLLCGDGPQLAELSQLAAAEGMDNVVFTGRTHDVAGILAAADGFVMPSRFEGMPNAMMEAMAAGLPCISTRRSGAVDIARDGVEALYYEADDAPALVGLVRRLLEVPGLMARLGSAAVARVRQFDVPAFVKRFETILDGAAVPQP